MFKRQRHGNGRQYTSSTICPLLMVSCSGSLDDASVLRMGPTLTCPQLGLALRTFWHNELLLLPGPPKRVKNCIIDST